MIISKTPYEVSVMGEGGKIAARVLKQVLDEAVPGKTLLELDGLAEQLILESGAEPSFKKEKGYHWATCMCLNDIVVHGIPTEEKIKDGDVLDVDLGVFYKGWHTDTSWTKYIKYQISRIAVGRAKIKNADKIGNISPEEVRRFLETGEKALGEALKQCVPGKHVGDISAAMQSVVEGAGYSCVKQLVGHGVGRDLHEDPEVPCFVRGKTENTPLLAEGMVLAVEVIYNMGGSPVVYKNDDGWTIVTRDGLPSAVFEHTVAITKNGPEILTIS